jgi:hypothetical protein
VHSPRQSENSGRRRFGPAAMASLSKQRRTVVALLDGLPVAVKVKAALRGVNW